VLNVIAAPKKHVKHFKKALICASKDTSMTNQHSPIFTTYPHAHDVHDHALYLEHNLCDMSEFGSAVTEQDRAVADTRGTNPQLVQRAGHVATQSWERPGQDAVQMMPETFNAVS
jgi:hypothetical protein